MHFGRRLQGRDVDIEIHESEDRSSYCIPAGYLTPILRNQSSLNDRISKANTILQHYLNNIHSTKSFSHNIGPIVCTFDQQKLIGLHILVSDSSAPTLISILPLYLVSVMPQKCTKLDDF